MVNYPALSPDVVSGAARKDAKERGAFYTDEVVADFLVQWAIGHRDARALDPSFGGGAFLRTISTRIRELGGTPRTSTYGIELEPETHGEVSRAFARANYANPNNLICSDFFAVSSADLPAMDAVVGNPPFIRYQSFKGVARERALACAAREGVTLPQLTSSWAPFVVHACSFLREGGRLAMVLPMEFGYAAYARPVVRFLAQRFAAIHVLAFRKALFPALSEETILVLADAKKECDGRLANTFLHDLDAPSALAEFEPSGVNGVDVGGFVRGQRRLAEFLISSRARDLYARLAATAVARRMGDFADIGIGYVSGKNDFFHLDHETVDHFGIPGDFVRPGIFKGGAISGLRFTRGDWSEACQVGDAGYFLHVEPRPRSQLPAAVRAYIEYGERAGAHQGYKCTKREHWYSVPHVYCPDGFLTYMSGAFARLVENDAHAVAPNTLHVVRLHRGSQVRMRDLAARWLTSLTQLSVEIEGHSLGGGMLKLEPKEAESVLVPLGAEKTALAPEVQRELDTLLRAGEFDRARAIADDVFLRGELGLSMRECDILRVAAQMLRNRRQSRKKGE